jgi:hypothetical protein
VAIRGAGVGINIFAVCLYGVEKVRKPHTLPLIEAIFIPPLLLKCQFGIGRRERRKWTLRLFSESFGLGLVIESS